MLCPCVRRENASTALTMRTVRGGLGLLVLLILGIHRREPKFTETAPYGNDSQYRNSRKARYRSQTRARFRLGWCLLHLHLHAPAHSATAEKREPEPRKQEPA
jgi:hypothetical protein